MHQFVALILVLLLSACGTSDTEAPEDNPGQPLPAGSLYEVTLDEATIASQVPKTADHRQDGDYMQTIDALLASTAAALSDTGVFSRLVKAVAWTESNWRHYLFQDGKYYVFLGDAGHSFGMMQIHDRYHDQYPVLEENLLYGAGLVSDCLSSAESKSCDSGSNSGVTQDRINRRTYACYNGGPSAICRDGDERDDRLQANYEDVPWVDFTSSRGSLTTEGYR